MLICEWVNLATMINTCAIILKLLLLPLVYNTLLPCYCYIIKNGLLVLITYSTLSLYYLFAIASDEWNNMFTAADEKNSMKRVALLMEQYWDEMSICYFLIVPFEIKPNQFASVSCPFPPVVYFSGFHVLCFKFWLLYASYSQVIITIS